MFITGFTQDRSACTRLRIFQTIERIGKLGLAETHNLQLSDSDPDGIIEKTNVALIGRTAGDHAMSTLTKMQMKGIKVAFDMDDNFMEISPMSPHYKDLGIMPVNLETEDGKSYRMWVDGQGGFDLKRNRATRKAFAEMVRAPACITVTTEPLRKVYGRYNDHVYVVPNSIDFRQWEILPIKHESDTIRILYTGASNHQEDFLYIRDPLAQLQKDFKNVTIVFVGSEWTHLRNDLDYKRVEVHPWVDIVAYPYLLKGLACHIGIAPITETYFNDCRSALKWMEYSALKLATVASDFGPYKRKVVDGKTGILATTEKEWYEGMKKLVTDHSIRGELAENAYKEVKNKFNLDTVVDTWMHVFNSIFKEK